MSKTTFPFRFLTRSTALLASVLALFMQPLAHAGLIQSPVRPFGLEIVSDVQASGSDEDARVFNSEALPLMKSWLNQNFLEASEVDDSAYSLPTSRLTLPFDSPNARVYFVGEGAGFHNTLGFNLEGPSLNMGDPKLIFPDASSYGRGNRDEAYPLMPGDFVDLGNIRAGTTLNFFLIANGANGGGHVWSTDSGYNKDGLNHVVSLILPDSPYLMIGFEDLYGGGDRDFNDVVFALDLGSRNMGTLRERANVTDAGATLSALGISLFSLFALQRFKRKFGHLRGLLSFEMEYV